MKTVIIGAHGVIGNALFKAFSARFSDCIGLTTKTAPGLTTIKYDLSYLRDYISSADAVIYCVGVTKFADCEQNPEKSRFLNCDLPVEIARQLSPRQMYVYLSSPIVHYDFGDAKANTYAQHKRMAEEALEQSEHENYMIIRPSKVIESADIIRNWKNDLVSGKNIKAFSDQFISPINTAILSDQIMRLLHDDCVGVYNFSARDRLSYLDIAKALAAKFKLNSQLIEEKSARSDNPFFFEQDILDCSQAEEAVGYVPPFSQNIVRDYLQALA